MAYKSRGQTSTVVWSLTSAGIGITTAMHIGSEPVVGSSFAEILPLFEADEETKAVVLFGEIGTVAEEEASEVIKEGRFTKPLVAYIAGRTLPAGMRFSPPGPMVIVQISGSPISLSIILRASLVVVPQRRLAGLSSTLSSSIQR